MIYTVTHDKMRDMALEWISKNDTLVEVGCNTGNFADIVNKKKIKNYTGIDIQSDKIDEARKKFPNMNFVNCNILKNLNLLKNATVVATFQSLEHIKQDLDIIKAIPLGCKVIISVPNSKYKTHVRWFELNGWKKRYEPYIDFDEAITIQNPKKLNKRAFLFKGVRNAYKD